MPTSTRRVTSTDGVDLAVQERGDPAAPTIVAIHGYPDNHAVWDGVGELLARDFHVVTYDVRGTGDSDKPTARESYRFPRLVDDLRAVLDAVSADAPVHLLGHDWGSIQGWAAVADERLAGRISAFSSISGPSVHYSAAWLRDVRRHPAASLRQLAHSYYIFLFQLPRLPEYMVTSGLLTRLVNAGSDRTPASPPPPKRRQPDMINGIELYRANMMTAVRHPRPAPTALPVQVIVPDSDTYVTPALAAEAPAPWVADLTVQHVSGGHWVVSESPGSVAPLVAEFARAHAAGRS